MREEIDKIYISWRSTSGPLWMIARDFPNQKDLLYRRAKWKPKEITFDTLFKWFEYDGIEEKGLLIKKLNSFVFIM